MKRIKNTSILGVEIDSIDCSIAKKVILDAIKRNKKGFVCVSAVHLVMECQKDENLLEGVNRSLLTTPDGMPLVWISKLSGKKNTKRVYGPDLMLKICSLAQNEKIPISLLGGKKNQSKELEKKLIKKFPNLKICHSIDTPIRPIPQKDNQIILKKISQSKARIIFVGMGCPNQEKWMIENIDSLNNVILIGVGAAFDFFTEKTKQAPKWMQKIGFEWLFRLIQEPKRLWKRYLIQNNKFIYLLIKKLCV